MPVDHHLFSRPTFIRIWKKGSVEQFSSTPYLATLINCMVWVIYGLPMVHPNSTLVVTINGTGTAIEVAYLTLFLIFCHEKRNRLKVLLIVVVEIISIAIVTAVVLTLVHTTERRSMVVGIIAILFNIMMYASPLSVMVSNCKICMPLPPLPLFYYYFFELDTQQLYIYRGIFIINIFYKQFF